MGYDDANIKIEHTAKKIFIINDGPAASVSCVAVIVIKCYDDIPFIFCFKSCCNKRKILLKLYDSSTEIEFTDCHEESTDKLRIGKEVQGVISHKGEYIETHIGDVELYTDFAIEEYCELGIKLNIGDQVHILMYNICMNLRGHNVFVR